MRGVLKKYIRRIYFDKDYAFFRERSEGTPYYIYGLITKLTPFCKEITDSESIDKDDKYPGVIIVCCFDGYSNKHFNISYTTYINISKVANIFTLFHQFEIENINPNKIEPTLDGFGEKPYTVQQKILEDELANYLIDNNVQRIGLDEAGEVIEGIDMPKNNLFGTQMTVETALFHDVWEIIKD